MGALSIKKVDKIYPGNVHAVKDFSLEIEDGEFIVLVGPSGCGKSSMMRMIAGLEPISGGDMVLDGVKINEAAPADRNIAMVFQNYALFGNMTAYENMGVPLAIRHVNGDIIHEKVMEAAETVEITTQLNRRPRAMSGGQRQRVAIGRSLVRDPHIFLMDEPLSNLDAKLRAQTRKELAMLHNKLGTTFVYVTHDQVEAMTMADRIVIMNEGRIQQVGTPIEVYKKPANYFVGGFIGSPAMNFITGEIEGDRFVSPELNLALSEEQKTALREYQKREVILGIRPEDFKRHGEARDGIKFEIDVVECLGCDYILYLKWEDRVYRVKLPVDPEGLHHGDIITLYPDHEAVSIFDVESTMRIV